MNYLSKINSDPNLFYIAIRAFIIYVYATFLIRFGNKRFNFKTSFDYVFIFIVGSVLSRCVNGTSDLIDTIVSSFVIVILHWLFAVFAFKSHGFGRCIKGEALMLIKNGELQWDALRKSQITQADLHEFARDKLGETNFSQIKEAYLERSGRISFIKKEKDELSFNLDK